jgi:Photosynthesis system II assembly factor YCF48
MPELSTILRERLRATVEPTSQHPDADVLTAYVEELLPAHERESVVQHLSLCSECREVVALTTPDIVAAPEPQAEPAMPAMPAVVSMPRRRWFVSPAFGLAGSIAAMVLGVALILRLPPTAKQTATTSTTQRIQESQTPAAAAPSTANGLISQNSEAAPLPPIARQRSAPIPAPALQANAESGVRADLAYEAPVRKATAVPEAKGTAAAPVFTAELGKQDYVNKMFLANSSETAAAAPAFRDLPQAPVPVQPNVFFAPPAVVAGSGYQKSGAFEVSSNTAGRNQGIVTFYSREPQGSRGTSLLDKIVDLGKRPLARRPAAPIRSGSLGSSAMFTPGMDAAQSADAITAKSKGPAQSGVLEQSQAFRSNALAALPPRQMLGAPQYQWKVVQGKLLRSSDQSHWTEENPAGESVEFSVVSANGPEIWAGGSQAALLHSRDAGTTWERITLGAAAVGTISSIEAAGQNLLVKSSSGQSWTSQDGGRSWVLQD